MEERRQRIQSLEQLATGVYRRPSEHKPPEVALLPKLNPEDFPRALPIKRVERLVGRRVYTPDS